MVEKLKPLFDKPVDEPMDFHGLLGWSADWRCINDPEEKPVPLDHIESLDQKDDAITVQKGDTLEKIAKDNNISIKELAENNGIKNPSLIYPGQVIKLPSYKYSDEMSISETSSNEKCVMSFTFQDLIEKPIRNLKVKLVALSGEVYESVTDELGKISDFILDKVSEVQVFVSAGAGELKKIASISPLESKNNIQLTSPKVRIRGVSSALKGQPGHLDSQAGVLNSVTKGRDGKGNPVIQVNHTCPNQHDLNLGKNVIYWDDVIAASKRSGIIPQSIAAIINAESAKDKDLVWKQDSVCLDSARIKKVKKHRLKAGLSTENIIFYKSSAAGMTQFLNATWIDETFRRHTYLNEKARLNGLIKDFPITDKKGSVNKDEKGEAKTEQKLNIQAGLWKDKNEILKSGLVSGKTPYPKKATQAIQAWLDKRFVAEYAIMAAVDYGVNNIASLKSSGFNIDSLNDAEKAKIIYLTHHLGLRDAKRFLSESITNGDAEILLKAQVGVSSADNYAEEHGGYAAAHRYWLNRFINMQILLKHFYCPGVSSNNIVEDVDLKDVINKLSKSTLED